ncbi:hypothetical protein HJG60_009974 [Phyllostomus discolor]|uniref:Uncharacterized protein n=1 Tax=Phyllostomus discolor TaxID=89673 RepID=A0A834EQ73_9CHIR|nr:hypothetical protein HJG60_009974 [Phyllostomus discolor]
MFSIISVFRPGSSPGVCPVSFLCHFIFPSCHMRPFPHMQKTHFLSLKFCPHPRPILAVSLGLSACLPGERVPPRPGGPWGPLLTSCDSEWKCGGPPPVSEGNSRCSVLDDLPVGERCGWACHVST